MVIELFPVTQWMPNQQAPTRSDGLTVADALGSLSLGDHCEAGDETKEPNEGRNEAPAFGLPSAGRAWAGADTQPESDGLWRPSPKVAAGPHVEGRQADNLSEQGKLAVQGNLQVTGKVVFILKADHREDHMGSLVITSALKADGKMSDQDSYVMFHPADRRVPYILIARGELPSLFVDNPGAYANSIFMACMKPEWPVSSKLPWGENVRFVGEAGEIDTETKALLRQHGVDHGDFPPGVLRSLQNFLPENTEEADPGTNIRGSKWKIPQEEIAKRRDLRKERIFTIDPTGARDLDDALSVTPLADGTIEMGVHIADVTYFIRPNSDLDQEARRRATTVYLVQKAIPMLPPLLCEELCSLNPQVDRLTYSCIWRMHADGTLVDEPAWFGRTVIRSCCKLDYQTAQNMIEGSIKPEHASSTAAHLWDPNRRPTTFTCEEVCNDVLLMNTLAKERRAKRFENGSLSLNVPKLTFKLDDNGNPIEFASYPIRDSNKLVEEYMLLANFLVAQQMLEVAGSQAFLRMHPPPEGLESLKKQLAGCGFEMDITSSASIQASLLRIGAQCDDEDIFLACTMMATIPMQLAEYVAAGKADTWKHYALAIPCYTHFTSPIRRYADVMVHRILTATLEGGDAMARTYDVETVKTIADHCNDKRLAAKHAQERGDEVYLAVHVQSNPLEVEAVVVSLGRNCFTVNVPHLGLTERIYLDKILDATSTFDETEKSLFLQAKSTTANGWTTATIKVMSKVVVRCMAAEKKGPIQLLLQFLWPK